MPSIIYSIFPLLFLLVSLVYAQPAWVDSGAPIGDSSVYVYSASWAGVELNMRYGTTNQDTIRVYGLGGAGLTGFHVYRVNAAPNYTAGLPGGSIRNDVYWGVFPVGNTAATYSATIHYGTNSNLSTYNEPCIYVYNRDANDVTSWAQLGGTRDMPANNIGFDHSGREEFILDNLPKVTKPDLGADDTVCNSKILTISPVVSGVTYNWYMGSGTTPVATGPSYTVTTTGTYRLEASNDCSVGRDTIFVRVETGPPAKPNLGADDTVCVSKVFSVPAAAGVAYRWFRGSTEVGSGPTYTATVGGTYRLEATNACGTVSDAILLGIDTAPPAPFSVGPDAAICAGGSGWALGVTAVSGVNYQWFRGSTPVGSGPTYTATVGGTYRLEATNACGTVSAVVILQDAAKPAVPNLGPDGAICTGNNCTLSVSPVSAGVSYRWYLDGQEIATGPLYTANLPGTYRLDATNVCGTVSDEVNLTDADIPLPEFRLPQTPAGCTLINTRLCAPLEAGITYNWQNTAGQVLSSAICFTPTVAGSYRLEVRNACGTSLRTEFDVEEGAANVNPGLWGNAFSPNSDGLHDTYPPSDLNPLAPYVLAIYNRWGQRVYEGSRPWDGRYEGTDAPEGAYVVVITWPDCTGRTQKRTSTVMVIR